MIVLMVGWGLAFRSVASQFGGECEASRRRTARLFPGVW
jgi:hypothetical protein